MAGSISKSGCILTLTHAAAKAAGEGALFNGTAGTIFGVALGAYGAGAEGEYATEGLWDLDKLATDDFIPGDLVYWDDTDKRCEKTSAPNLYLIGKAAETTAASAARVKVLVLPGLTSDHA